MEESALDHLESCAEELDNLMERPIIVNAGRVSIYTKNIEDSIACYKALKTIFGEDLTRLGPNILRKVLEEERRHWNKLRQNEI